METLQLEENDIQRISSYVSSLREIGRVEGVMLIPFYLENGEKRCEIHVIQNPTNEYLKKIRSLGFSDRFGSEFAQCVSAIGEDLFIESKESDKPYELTIGTSSSDDYVCKYFTQDRISATRLVSGTIIFDRFNNLRKRKESLSKEFKPLLNLMDIDNQDELINAVEKNEKGFQYRSKS